MGANLAETVLTRLIERYGAARDDSRAVPMRAYMRDQFPFLGLSTPARRVLDRQVLAGLARPTEDDLRTVSEECWALPEREYQYFACGWLRRHARECSAAFLPHARSLITTKPWWDTVDALASHLAGPMAAGHPAVAAAMDEWIADDDMWVVRTALLHQLRYGGGTDSARLFDYCLRQAGHPDFFVRKAIGWALREYAKTAPDAVRGFVNAHREALAPLSVREALKNIGPTPA